MAMVNMIDYLFDESTEGPADTMDYNYQFNRFQGTRGSCKKRYSIATNLFEELKILKAQHFLKLTNR